MNALQFFSEGTNPALMNLVNCSGSEQEILECNHIQSTHGLFCNPAGVVCQVDVEASNCSTGNVRLVGSGDGDEGRLEVCVNRAWGTVCSDEFDTADASVACQSLNGFNGNGKLEILTSLKCWKMLYIWMGGSSLT